MSLARGRLAKLHDGRVGEVVCSDDPVVVVRTIRGGDEIPVLKDNVRWVDGV